MTNGANSGEDERFIIECRECGETYVGATREPDSEEIYIMGRGDECVCGSTALERL